MAVTFVVISVLAVGALAVALIAWQQAERQRRAVEKELEERKRTHPYSPDDKKQALEKSKDVREGNAFEQMAPLLRHYPHDARYVRFLGRPIDQVAFVEDDDGQLWVLLIEIKKGQAGVAADISKPQRAVRQSVIEGRVLFQTLRVVETPQGAECIVQETKGVAAIPPPPGDTPYPRAATAPASRQPLFRRNAEIPGRMVRVRPPERR